MKSVFLISLMAGAFATALVAGCIIGDGDVLTREPPLQPCRLYPEDALECGKPWSGHIVQTCGNWDSISTRLHYDRPDVSDSMRTNVMELGALLIDTLRMGDKFYDTATVCDRGACRDFVIELRILEYFFPGHTGIGRLEFLDSAGMLADGGSIKFDDVRKESCP